MERVGVRAAEPCYTKKRLVAVFLGCSCVSSTFTWPLVNILVSSAAFSNVDFICRSGAVVDRILFSIGFGPI